MIDNLGNWVFFLVPSLRIHGILCRDMVSAGFQSETSFRTINVQWIGQWGLFRPSSTSWNQ
jgi:hypothetical protein